MGVDPGTVVNRRSGFKCIVVLITGKAVDWI
jgi:hypothetical protein